MVEVEAAVTEAEAGTLAEVGISAVAESFNACRQWAGERLADTRHRAGQFALGHRRMVRHRPDAQSVRRRIRKVSVGRQSAARQTIPVPDSRSAISPVPTRKATIRGISRWRIVRAVRTTRSIIRSPSLRSETPWAEHPRGMAPLGLAMAGRMSTASITRRTTTGIHTWRDKRRSSWASVRRLVRTEDIRATPVFRITIRRIGRRGIATALSVIRDTVTGFRHSAISRFARTTMRTTCRRRPSRRTRMELAHRSPRNR